MKKLLILVCSVILFSQQALADEAGCSEKAAANKLAGEVKYKFITKCEIELESARKKCAILAADKGLMGDAKFDFIKKCVKGETN